MTIRQGEERAILLLKVCGREAVSVRSGSSKAERVLPTCVMEERACVGTEWMTGSLREVGSEDGAYCML